MACSRLCGSSLITLTLPKLAPTASTYERSVGDSAAFDVHRASLSVLPLSQKPRQSSSPSADASGAKLVSPPLFQSMYSRPSHSVDGISSRLSARTTTPVSASAGMRWCGVSKGICTLQCSPVGQKLMAQILRGDRCRRRCGQRVDDHDARRDLQFLTGLDVVSVGDPVERHQI